MKIHEIRELKAQKVAEARALLDANKTLTADQQAAFDKLKAEITELEGQEQRAAFIAEVERRSVGEPVSTTGDSMAALESRVSLSNVLRAQMEGRSLSGAELEYSQETERRTG